MFQGLQPICNSFFLVALNWTVLIASSTHLEGMTVKRDTGISQRGCIRDQLLLTTFLADCVAIASRTLDGLDVSFKCLFQQFILYTHLRLHPLKPKFCLAVSFAQQFKMHSPRQFWPSTYKSWRCSSLILDKP